MSDKAEQIRLPKPPKGFKTWIDWALTTANYRDAFHQSIMNATRKNPEAQPYLMRAAALAELDAIRVAAGMKDTFPKKFRKSIEDDLADQVA